MFKYLLFDLDETILDYTRTELYALKKTMKKFSVRWNKNIQNAYKIINESLWKKLENGNITIAEIRVLRFKTLFEQHNIDADFNSASVYYLDRLCEGAYTVKDAARIIKELSKNHVIAGLSNGIKKVQFARLEKAGLLKYFTDIISSEEAAAAKPDPAIFDYAFKKLGICSKKDVIIIGDSPDADITGGINYGIKTCFFNPLNIETNGIRPDYEIKKLKELPALLKGK